MIITNEMKEHFYIRMNKHIDLVNYFANKLSLSFPNHDKDKFSEQCLNTQIIFSWCKKNNIPLPSKDELDIDYYTLRHIMTQKHHPEYYVTNKRLLVGFTRNKPTYNLPCQNMERDSLIEMCCDWCAMSKEFHNTPHSWANKTVNKRWLFTEEQTKLIYEILDFLSEDEDFS